MSLIYKAERADGKGEVEGFLTHDVEFNCYRIRTKSSNPKYIWSIHSIKPETLRIVIGDSEFTQEEVEELVKPKSCESCRYFKDGDSLQWCVNEELNKQIDPDGKIDDWFTPTYDFCCNKYKEKE